MGKYLVVFGLGLVLGATLTWVVVSHTPQASITTTSADGGLRAEEPSVGQLEPEHRFSLAQLLVLTSVRELPPSESVVQIATTYLSEKKQWRSDDYLLVNGGVESALYLVNAIHSDDLNPKKPLVLGGAKSVLLHIDLEKKAVVKEIRFYP